MKIILKTLAFVAVTVTLQAQEQQKVEILLDPVATSAAVVAAPPGNALSAGGSATSPLSDAQTLASAYYATNVKLGPLLRALARKCGLQVFTQPELDKYTISGRIDTRYPRNTINDIARSYGLVAYDNGSTLFINTVDEIKKMPTRSVSYNLRYLPQAQIEKIITPLLTAGAGSVTTVPKTNSIVIRDNELAIANILDVLRRLDNPAKQINLQFQVFRLSNNNDGRYGVDWAQALGENGYPVSFGVNNSLDMLFNLSSNPGATFTGPTAAILQPGAVNLLFRALKNSLGLEQISSPNMILEDNEPGVLRLSDRYPIVEFQPSSATSNIDFISLSSEIRYKIDKSDPSATATDPGRELGISVKVLPTALPDGTIRLNLEPRSAEITEFIKVPTGSSTPDTQTPRVSDASLSTTVRVPNGMTVLLGGIYSLKTQERESKVPVLGDIPVLNVLFKDRSTSKEKTNLVFAITPTLYDPVKAAENEQSNRIFQNTGNKNEQMVKDNLDGAKPLKLIPKGNDPDPDSAPRDLSAQPAN